MEKREKFGGNGAPGGSNDFDSRLDSQHTPALDGAAQEKKAKAKEMKQKRFRLPDERQQ